MELLEEIGVIGIIGGDWSYWNYWRRLELLELLDCDAKLRDNVWRVKGILKESKKSNGIRLIIRDISG
ncbi:MAG: hypothetical protein K2H35_00830 [Muribaculaceae bacterium]|nr:hypothetical protein [Muribaculaceae bacterium]